MLSCKQVATLASQYLDKDTRAPLTWKIRMHLLMCANCRRFIKHLKITRQVTSETSYSIHESISVDEVLKRIKQQVEDEKKQQ